MSKYRDIAEGIVSDHAPLFGVSRGGKDALGLVDAIEAQLIEAYLAGRSVTRRQARNQIEAMKLNIMEARNSLMVACALGVSYDREEDKK